MNIQIHIKSIQSLIFKTKKGESLETTKTFENTYEYLKNTYHYFFVGKYIVANEMDIEVSTVNARIASKIGIPPFIKIGNESNGKFFVTLIDLAYFLSEDNVNSLSCEERREYIYQYFIKKYQKISINKKHFAEELTVCENTMSTYIKRNYVPQPKRYGTSKNTKITFNVNDLADHFSVVNQTM